MFLRNLLIFGLLRKFVFFLIKSVPQILKNRQMLITRYTRVSYMTLLLVFDQSAVNRMRSAKVWLSKY